MVKVETEPQTVEQAIEIMRGMEEAVVVNLSVTKVLGLVDALKAAVKSRTAIEHELALTTSEVLDTIVEFGVWLGQSQNQKGAVAVETVAWEKVAVGRNGQLRLFLDDAVGDDVTIVPDGFDRKSCGRDVKKALRTIVNATVDDTVVLRWLLRRQHHVHAALTYDIVCALHGVVAMGRGAELNQLVMKGKWRNTSLARRIVAAYDLLEYARRDAVAAAEALSEGSWHAIADNARRARWLDEGALTRLADLAAGAEHNPQKAVAAQRELDLITRRLRSRGALPKSIRELNAGMVRRISEAAGLACDPPAYDIESRVRHMIEQAGLGADKDVLYPDGLMVVSAGMTEEFDQALARRSAGRLDWADELNAALSQRN